jgi:hypothetical protein
MIGNRREAKRPWFNVYHELLMLHKRITATLAAKLTAEKEALISQLRQADMSVH